jgi:hypothetical protein
MNTNKTSDLKSTKHVSFSREQLNLINKDRASQIKRIEATRNPNHIYKWLPTAFVKLELYIVFRDGIQETSFFNNVEIGIVSITEDPVNCVDMRYRIGKNFQKFLSTHKDFVLHLEPMYKCKTFDMRTEKMIRDFSIADDIDI